MRLAGDGGELLERYGARELRKGVLDAFPDLRPELDDDADIHQVMAALERATMDAARAGDLARARSILAFVKASLDVPNLDSEVPNAVSISFVEPVALEESEAGRRVSEGMPAKIHALVLENQNRIERRGDCQ